jgi:uncharacterized protein
MESLERELSIASILYLVLTKDCNYACKYCPFSAILEKEKKKTMTPEIARKGINLWVEHIKDRQEHKDYSIILYGGEPLLVSDLLEYILGYIKELQTIKLLPSLSVMLDTNGSLLSEELVLFLRKNNVKVTVGCDGPEEINDLYRVDRNGKGTFKKTKEAIDLLVKSEVETFASVSITPESIPRIDDIVSFFQNIGVRKIGFNILRGKLLLSVHPEIDLERYYNEAAEAIIKNFLEREDKTFEYQMQKRVDIFYGRQPLSVDCGGYGNQLVIQPDGGISNCPFLTRTLGNLDYLEKDFRIWNVSTVKRWRERLPLYNPECKNCPAKKICGGGCAWNALQMTGSLLNRDKAICIFNKKVFEFLSKGEKRKN